MPKVYLPPTADELFHSHSDMTRQVEELESHALALRSADGDEQAMILDDLVDFATQFSAHVRGHIIEEENDLFPRCRPHLTASAQAMLHRIQDQHRELETSIDTLMGRLETAQNSEEDLNKDLIDSIYVRAQLLRYNFNTHSIAEREFFEEVIRYINRGG